MTGPVCIWERKRRAVRAELSEVALELLTNRDFESVTVDEITAAMHPRPEICQAVEPLSDCSCLRGRGPGPRP